MPYLRYLFTVTYRDGTTYAQTQADVSHLDPETPRNCLYDVINGYPNPFSEVARFELTDQESDHQRYAVDLFDGHFEHNGLPFTMNGEGERDPQSPFKLISHMQVFLNHMTPYIFKNPRRYGQLPDGRLEVIDSAGNSQKFPSTARIELERKFRTDEIGEKMVDEHQNQLVDDFYCVYPQPDWERREFHFGWESKDAQGKNVKRIYIIS